jgi:hypothetical protein
MVVLKPIAKFKTEYATDDATAMNIHVPTPTSTECINVEDKHIDR